MKQEEKVMGKWTDEDLFQIWLIGYGHQIEEKYDRETFQKIFEEYTKIPKPQSEYERGWLAGNKMAKLLPDNTRIKHDS